MESLKLNIISETENYLVINKPAGLLVHPAPGKDEKTLADFLLDYFPKIKDVGDNPIRPGIVHRLDRDVSGLLVVAKTHEMFAHLKEQFKVRKTKKIYKALVFNKLKENSGRISLPIGRSGRGVKMSVNYGKDVKPALTEYRVLQNYLWDKQELSFVEIKLHTGRTHQIRVHFQSQGHPLVGDTLYKIKRINQPENFDRIFLQAVELGFKDLANENRYFQISLDKELKTMLNKFTII